MMQIAYKTVVFILGVMIFTGCGGGGAKDINKNTTSPELVGSWKKDCQELNGYSSKKTTIFTDTRQALIQKKYGGGGCDENELISHSIIRFNYNIGDITKFSNGKNSTELNLVTTGSDTIKGDTISIRSGLKLYMMFSIVNEKLYLSGKDEAGLFGGATPLERRNEFPANDYYKKL